MKSFMYRNPPCLQVHAKIMFMARAHIQFVPYDKAAKYAYISLSEKKNIATRKKLVYFWLSFTSLENEVATPDNARLH